MTHVRTVADVAPVLASLAGAVGCTVRPAGIRPVGAHGRRAVGPRVRPHLAAAVDDALGGHLRRIGPGPVRADLLLRGLGGALPGGHAGGGGGAASRRRASCRASRTRSPSGTSPSSGTSRPVCCSSTARTCSGGACAPRPPSVGSRPPSLSEEDPRARRLPQMWERRAVVTTLERAGPRTPHRAPLIGHGPVPRAERRALGRDLRSEVPRSAHAAWVAHGTRPDPLDQLAGQDLFRRRDLVPIRYGRMSLSPWSFFRGSAAVMAADLATLPRTDLFVQLCGDAHIGNFGLFASPDRRTLFDINDFDETHRGPFEWDVKRLAASVRGRGALERPAPVDQERAAAVAVRYYRESDRQAGLGGHPRRLVLPGRVRARAAGAAGGVGEAGRAAGAPQRAAAHQPPGVRPAHRGGRRPAPDRGRPPARGPAASRTPPRTTWTASRSC